MSATTIKVNDVSPRRQYTATAAQTVFDFPIPFFEQGDLTVYLTPSGQSADDAADLLAISTNYTVSGENTQDGGLVTLLVGATAGDIVTIDRVLDLKRLADYQNAGDLLAETLNREQDSEIMISQQLRDDIDRSIKRSSSSSSTADLTLPEPAAEQLLGWNSAGSALVNKAQAVYSPGVEGPLDLRYAPKFATVAAMTAANPVSLDGVVVDLTVGMIVGIDDYASAGSGIIFGRVVAGATGTADGGSYIDLSNGNQFEQNFPTIINTKLFGDTAEDSVDSYASIQAAIDYANSQLGGTVAVSNGVRSISAQVRLYSDVTFLMEEKAVLRRDYNTSATGAGLIGLIGPIENVTIKGGALDVNGTNFPTGANAVGWTDGSNVLIDNVTFLNIPEFHAVDIADSDDVHINNCRFLGFTQPSGTRNFSEAIQLDPDIANGGNPNTNIKVTNCTFGDNPDNVDAGMLPWPVAIGNHAAFDGVFNSDVIFTGNVVTGASYGAVRLLNAAGHTIDSNIFNDCIAGCLFDFNQLAVGYEGCSNVVISDNQFISMTGASVLNGTTGFTTANGNAKHSGINITGNVVRLSGTAAAFDLAWIQNATVIGNNLRAIDRGIHVRFCSQLTISSNQIVNTDENGILVNEGTETDFAGLGLTDDILISGNSLNDLGFRGVHVNGAAVKVKISGNLIVDADSDAAGREGIKVDSNADKVTINGNTITSSGSPTTAAGIESNSTTNLKVYGNDSVGATVAYVLASTDAQVAIEDIGTPEGVITAGIGSTFRRLDGGAATSFYIKETGTGNTGWVGK